MLCSPYVVILNDSEEATLRRSANSARAPQRDVLRARIVSVCRNPFAGNAIAACAKPPEAAPRRRAGPSAG